MAKKKSFDPDALEKAGKDIVKKLQERENITPPPPVAPTPEVKVETKTKMVRIRPSYHKRLKRAALESDMSIQGFVEKLIDGNIQ